MARAILISRFLRARAWWRLDSVGVSAGRAARSVVSLLDAAAYLRELPDDDPAIAALEAAGCFANSVFDPGPEGWIIIRDWQLADGASAGPADLLARLVHAAGRDGPRSHLASLAMPLAPSPAGAISVPRQPAPASEPVPG